MAALARDAGDEAARRLAAVVLCSPRLRAASQEQVAAAFGVIPVSGVRWARALERGGWRAWSQECVKVERPHVGGHHDSLSMT